MRVLFVNSQGRYFGGVENFPLLTWEQSKGAVFRWNDEYWRVYYRRKNTETLFAVRDTVWERTTPIKKAFKMGYARISVSKQRSTKTKKGARSKSTTSKKGRL